MERTEACLLALQIAARLGVVPQETVDSAAAEMLEGRLLPEPTALADRLLVSRPLVEALLGLAATLSTDGQGESTATARLVQDLRGLRDLDPEVIPGSIVPPTPSATVASPAAAPIPVEVRDAMTRVHRRVGRYVLLSELGHGGMGIVYRAWDPSLARIVALKMLRGEREQVLRERFLREGRAMARLRHPGIIAVHDVGEEGGAPYLAMDFLPGRTMREALAAGRMVGLKDRAALLKSVAEAVGFAHSQGIVHRDLKPDNVLLDAQGRPVVTDFGLMRQAGGSTAETLPTLTEEGVVLGTPAYMSPEQSLGDHAVGPTSDVFSLGAMLYECITGRMPFEGSTLPSLLGRVAEANPIPPRMVRPGVPRGIETVCLKALEKDPSRRYPDAAALAADLGRWIAGEPVDARPPTLLRRAGRLARRHPKATSAAILLGAILVIGVSLWLVPGTLNLRVRPVGASVTIEGRSWTATEGPLPIDLRAGAYEVVVEASNHDRQVLGVRVERGRFRDVTVELPHHQGTLEAESDTPGSEIEVDGVAYGSRVRNLSLPTGRHSVRAWCQDHLERECEVAVQRDRTTRIFLSLERGVVWAKRPVPISGLPYFATDADDDGVQEVACREGADLVLRRIQDGAEMWRARVAESLRFSFHAVDFREDRRFLVVSREETSGLFVSCWDPKKTGTEARVWEFSGPKQSWKHPALVPVGVLPDRNGDGVRDLAVAGRDPAIWVIDGAKGTSIARLATPVFADFLTTISTDSGLALLFAGKPTDPALPAGQGAGETRFGVVSIEDGKEAWGRSVASGGLVSPIDVDHDGESEAICCEPGAVSLFDGRTGALRWAAKLSATTTVPQPTWADADSDGVDDALVAAGRRLSAWSGRSGARLWEVDCVAPSAEAPYAAEGIVIIPSDDSLSAYAVSTGQPRWKLMGRYRDLRPTDWDGDGRHEYFAGLRGSGLVCIDGSGRTLWTLRVPFDVVPAWGQFDVDGDGLGEVVACVDGSMIALVRGPRRLWTRTAAGSLLAAPVVLDTDGDGRPEVVQLGPWGEDRSLACLEGATGTIRWARTEVLPPNRGPGVGDIDRDGRPDLVQAGLRTVRADPFLAVFRASDGHPLRLWPQEGTKVYSAPAVVDLDLDGLLDAVIQRWDKQDVLAVRGSDGKTLWTRPVGAFAMGEAAVGDLDGDGRPEVVSPAMDGAVRALRGADGEPIWTARIEPEGSRATPTIADVDGDALPEVLLVSRRGTLWVLDGKTGLEKESFPGAADPVGRPVVARTREGKLLVIASQGDAGVAAIDVAARAACWRTRAGIPVIASPAVADFGGDGRLEVVVATATGVLAVLDLESGQALWQLRVSEQIIEAAPVVADLDGDGTLDVLVADHAGVLQVIHGRGIAARPR